MPKGSIRLDINQLAYSVVQASLGEDEPETAEKLTTEADSKKNRAAVALGKLGGPKGGKARTKKLSAECNFKLRLCATEEPRRRPQMDSRGCS